MMQRVAVVVLVSAYLVASLWMQRTGGSGAWIADLGASWLGVLVIAGLGWGAAALATRDDDRRLLVALLAVLWSVLYGTFHVVMIALLGPSVASPVVTALMWTLLLLVGTLGVVRSRAPLGGVTRALSAASVILMLFLVPSLLRGRPEPAASPAPWQDARSGERPDLYVVVLDKYTSGAWLDRVYGLDHTTTEDSLRALGFVVPRDARTNYSHTKLVLTSLLEGRLIDQATSGRGRAAYDALTSRIVGARFWSELREHGYRLTFFPTTFEGTRALPGADLVLNAPTATPPRWGESLVVNSPLLVARPLWCGLVGCEQAASAAPYPMESLDAIAWKLRTLATLPDSTGPIAAFVHLLIPHEPYLFAEDCSPREPWWPLTDLPPTDADSLRAAYAAQVRCLDEWLLEALTTLVTRSRVPPMIIVTGDHGNGRFARDVLRGFTLELDELTDDQLGERFGVFMALRIPGADTLVREPFTVVNVLPLVRHSLFGAPLEWQPDSSFWSPYQRALELTPVPASRLLPPAASTR